jgi:hypothetical protein
MSDAPAAPKPKKSVALSGVTAGNTALCTVGRTGKQQKATLDVALDAKKPGDARERVCRYDGRLTFAAPWSSR